MRNIRFILLFVTALAAGFPAVAQPPQHRRRKPLPTPPPNCK